MPKAQDAIISVLYLAKISLISMTSSLLAHFSKMDPSSCPQSTNAWNIIFILPEVKVGDNLTRSFLHLFPRSKNRCPVNGSISLSMNNQWSWKLKKSLTGTFLIISGSRNTNMFLWTQKFSIFFTLKLLVKFFVYMSNGFPEKQGVSEIFQTGRLVRHKVCSFSSSRWTTLWNRRKLRQGHRPQELPRTRKGFRIYTPYLQLRFSSVLLKHNETD